jgi:hypothetical protein
MLEALDREKSSRSAPQEVLHAELEMLSKQRGEAALHAFVAPARPRRHMLCIRKLRERR